MSDKKEVIQLGMVGVAAVFSIVLIVILGLNATISAEVAYYEKTQSQLCMEDCTNAFIEPSDRYSCYQTCLPDANVQKPLLEIPKGITETEKTSNNYSGAMILILLLIILAIILRRFLKKKTNKPRKKTTAKRKRK